MGIAAVGRAVFAPVVLLFCVWGVAAAQRPARASSPSPLRGSNFLGVHVGGNLTGSVVDDGQIPVPNGSFSPGGPGGAGFQFGLSFGRLMPDLFVSTATTAEFRLHYARLIGTSTASGLVRSPEGGGSEVPVAQKTTVSTTIAGGELRLAFDTRPMAKATPTVLLGLAVGHIADMRYDTEYDPAGIVRINDNGVPEGSVLPARRWFYSALHLGGGARLSLGDPATSPAIVPEVEVIIPFTSLSRYANWLPFGIRGGIGLRWPL